MNIPQVICTVDVVLLTLKEGALQVALLKRDHEPFAGTYALPGGWVHTEEDMDTQDAARRILKSKMNVESPYLEALQTFSGPARDPRGWSISDVYYALVPVEVLQAAAEKDMRLMPVDKLKALPFDHQHIVEVAVTRLRNKSQYSSLPVYLCGERFTLPKLQTVYEAVLGEPINKVSFRRKMDELDILEQIPGEKETGKANRPASLYRLKKEYRHALSITDRGLNVG